MDGEVLELEFYDDQSQYLDHKYVLVDGIWVPEDVGLPIVEINYLNFFWSKSVCVQKK